MDEVKNEQLEKPALNPKPKKKATLLNYLIYIGISYLIALIITKFIFTVVTVDGASMYPTLNSYESPKCSDNSCNSYDLAFCDLLTYKFLGVHRFDIVVVNHPSVGEIVVKRVIGLPNETVRYEEGILYINGKVVEEKFIDSQAKLDTNTIVEFTLGKDEYFVMGDNRKVSHDSRSFGAIKNKEIIGRGLFKFMTNVKKYNNVVDRHFMFPYVVK